ncbi:MAG: hypothetical protein HY246_24350 [Proteobacteria bacterium]|nr:hypothetical protein [Pseudomonadota bacterium]
MRRTDLLEETFDLMTQRVRLLEKPVRRFEYLAGRLARLACRLRHTHNVRADIRRAQSANIINQNDESQLEDEPGADLAST